MVLVHSFSTLGLNRVFAHHFARNPASGRVMQKIGMRHEGYLRQHVDFEPPEGPRPPRRWHSTQEPPMIRAVLIDLDGVIRTWRAQEDPAAEAGFGLPPGALRRVAFAPELLLPAITGRVADATWREQIRAELARRFPGADAAAAVDWWSSPYGEVNAEVLELLRACRRRAAVALVTNATSRLPDDLRRLGIAGAFDHLVNSSAVGAAKPEPAIFAAALAAAGVAAAEALFVDDTLGHVEAARRLGLAAHHYTGAAGLRDELLALGLLAP
jgi:putative hydrolase of the HAD superfamily